MLFAVVLSVVGVLVVFVVMGLVVGGIELQHRLLRPSSLALESKPEAFPELIEHEEKARVAAVAAAIYLARRGRQFDIVPVERAPLPSWRWGGEGRSHG